MKTRIFLALFYGLLFMLALGCNVGDNSAELQKKEQDELKQYIAANKITQSPTADGLYYIEKTAGKGISPVSTDFALINYSIFLIDGTLVETSDHTLAGKNNITPTTYLAGPEKVYVNYLYKGFIEGLCMMKDSGGTANLIVPSKLALDYLSTSSIPSYSTLLITVELVKVIKDPVADDRASINKWLDTLSLKRGDTTFVQGIYVKIDSLGSGDSVTTGNSVTVQYKGRLLDGRYFSNPAKTFDPSFSFTIKTNSVIPGFEKIVVNLKKGSLVRAIIPYYLAYGAGGLAGSNGQILIPLYSSLYYEIRINDIK